MIVLGDVAVDLERATVTRADGRSVGLSTRELQVLRYLVAHAGRDVAREELQCEIWGVEEMALSRAADVTVGRLRQKLESDPEQPVFLQTVHGTGYRLLPAGSAHTPFLFEAREQLVLESCVVELASGRLSGERSTTLTAAERKILVLLRSRDGELVSNEELLRVALGLPAHRVRCLVSAIYRLRQKLERNPAAPVHLVGVRNAGYCLRQTTQAAPRALGNDVYWKLACHAARALRIDDCVVYMKRSAHLEQVAAYGVKSPREGEILDPLWIPVGIGIVGHAAAEARSQLVHDTRSDSRYIHDLYLGRSEIAVPIIAEDAVVGVIDCEAQEVGAFDESDRLTLESLAELAQSIASAWPSRAR